VFDKSKHLVAWPPDGSPRKSFYQRRRLERKNDESEVGGKKEK